MATRKPVRSAVDRLKAARAVLAEEQAVHRVHLKVCARCSHARGDTMQLCDDGWQQLKAITRAGNRVRKLAESIELAARQGTLW